MERRRILDQVPIVASYGMFLCIEMTWYIEIKQVQIVNVFASGVSQQMIENVCSHRLSGPPSLVWCYLEHSKVNTALIHQTSHELCMWLHKWTKRWWVSIIHEHATLFSPQWRSLPALTLIVVNGFLSRTPNQCQLWIHHNTCEPWSICSMKSTHLFCTSVCLDYKFPGFAGDEKFKQADAST